MKRFFFPAVLCAVLLILPIGGSGCMGYKQQNITEEALAYMEQKYGEKFEYVAPWGSSLANRNKLQMLVKCVSLSDEVFVEVNYIENEYIFSDNYVAVKYTPETNKLLQSAIDNFFEKSFVVCNISQKALSPDLLAEATFEQYCSDSEASLSATIFIPDSVFEETSVKKFGEKLADSNMGATIRFFSVDDSIYESLKTDNIEDIVDENNYSYFSVIIIYDGSVQINPREVK
jgi:hypothetical protein